MAKKRLIDTKFWDDNYVGSLTPVEKLLFLYLITNALTTVIGVYEIRLDRISLDTGIDKPAVSRIIDKFQGDNRVTYIDGWMIVHNFEKHQSLRGELIEKAKNTLFKDIPDRVYKAYQYPMDTLPSLTSVSVSESNSNKRESEGDKKPQDSLEVTEVAECYNALIQPAAKLTNGARQKIKSRLKTYSVSDIYVAMKKFSDDRWQMEHNAHRGMAWFFHSDDRIEQYINLKERKRIEL